MTSVSIANLSWQTPSNHIVFDDLNLTFGPGRNGLVGRNGTGKSTLLRFISGELSPGSGSITAPSSIGYLRQSADEVSAATLADVFGVTDQLRILSRAERGEATADDLAVADWTLEARLEAALTSLGLHLPPDTQMGSLSGGQRTRAALAALLFADHDVLLLDEPTNHLDRNGREHVMKVLRDWSGCVIVASHDRTLLEEMDTIIELTSLGAKTYGCPFSAYRAAKQAELENAADNLAQAQRNKAATESRAQSAAERKARTDRQGIQLRASGSQSKLILNAAKERSEGSGGSAARLRDRQAKEAEADLNAAHEAIEVLEPLTIDISPSGLVSTRQVLKVDHITFGYCENSPIITDFSLSIQGPERLAIEGANGTGKSTLLSCIEGKLQPQFGSVAVQVPFTLIDQEMSFLDPEETVREALARLDSKATENDRRATLARFLFRGDDADQKVGLLSGGQRMRAGLACSLGHSEPRQLLLLDEPSDHLDIAAVETLEAALRAYDGAIVVVSHDQAFLNSIEVQRRVAL
ncbi:ABC-F family ATP-binding cassette domain-containing protein [Yoonia litorea]|uniref:ATPase components of ABC transporters with duplicated ATPase domains n=1 Tax=Yoonia litorea TaxID=1123755 RepID=A0A1I6L541_9RHOB|nr:ABC-F family ATP-binding cassette domain-containing protein [Yoonia litorea]SFR98556.1 ATPase components of ABC transporters with duplicated ATPase domains [Yoonia litorea]